MAYVLIIARWSELQTKCFGGLSSPPSTSNHGTWASILTDIQLYVHLSWTPYSIKAHVGFHLKELADTLAK